MKKNLIRIVSLALVAVMLTVCASCTQVVNVRFVDEDGNEIDFAGMAGADSGSYSPPATAAVSPENQAAPAADATPAAAQSDAPAAASDDLATASGGKFQTKEDVLAFYKSAVAKVKGGAAGYEKKAWQKVPALNIFGSDVVNNKIIELAGNYMQTEETAPVEHNEKGSDEAIRRMPDCTLTDMSKIKDVTCTMDGSNYSIKIILVEEKSPATKSSSMLGQITDNFLSKEEIDNELGNISVISDFDYDLIYKDYTISAVITPDGQFVSMLHHSSVEIIINSLKILMIPISNKSATLDADCSFSNFTY